MSAPTKRLTADLTTQCVRDVATISEPHVEAVGDLLSRGRLFGVRFLPDVGALGFVQLGDRVSGWVHIGHTVVAGIPVAQCLGHYLCDSQERLLWPQRSALEIWRDRHLTGAGLLDAWNRTVQSEITRSRALAGAPFDPDRFPAAWQSLEMGKTLAQHAAVMAARKVAA